MKCLIFLFFALLLSCSNYNFPKIQKRLNHYFVSHKISIDRVSFIDIIDIDSDGDEELIQAFHNKVFVYFPSSMKTFTISIDEEIENIMVIKENNQIVIFSKTKIYSYRNNEIHVILHNQEKNTPLLMLSQYIDNDHLKDFFLLYVDEEKWFYKILLANQNSFREKNIVIDKSFAIFPPELCMLNGFVENKIVIKTDFDLLVYKENDDCYTLIQKIPFSRSKEMITAKLDNTDQVYSILSKPNKIVISSEKEKEKELHFPEMLNMGTFVKDINHDGFQDIVSFGIIKKMPSILDYFLQGKINLHGVFYEFMNHNGTFSTEYSHSYQFKIPLTNLKKQTTKNKKKVLYVKDIDNDFSIDVIVWDSERKNLLLYYGVLEDDLKKCPSYIHGLKEGIYQDVYNTMNFLPSGFPDCVVSLDSRYKISQIFTLKTKNNLHDVIVVVTEKEILVLVPQ